MNLYLLSIGINNYWDDSIVNLTYAEKDARDVFNMFKSVVNSSFFKGKLLTGKDATLKMIKQNAGEWLPDEVHKDDSVIFYFAGHGAIERVRNISGTSIMNYLVPADASINNLYSTAFSLREDLGGLIRRIPSDHITVILDCCFSGGSKIPGARGIEGINLKMEKRLSGFDMKSKVMVKENRAVDLGIGTVQLLACGPDEPSLESITLENGIYTHHFIKVVSSFTGTHSISTLIVHEEVSKLVEAFTQGKQNPILEGRLQKHKLVSF